MVNTLFELFLLFDVVNSLLIILDGKLDAVEVKFLALLLCSLTNIFQLARNLLLFFNFPLNALLREWKR